VPDDKLGRQLGLGSPGMARRFGADDEAASDRLARARAALSEASARAGVECRALLMQDRHLEAIKAAERARAAPSAAVEKKVRGRPKVGGERPWVAAGLSRRTWYRRQGGKAGE
jgi:hypothetical protein